MCAQFAGMIFLISPEHIFWRQVQRIYCILYNVVFTVRNNIMDEELKDYYCRKYLFFVNIVKNSPEKEGGKTE